MQRERRTIPFAVAELRIEKRDTGNTLTGITAPFGKLSVDLGGWQERIEPGAFAGAISRSDPVALFNHQPDNLLGRLSAGTLRLKETDAGLTYEVDLPDTEIARMVSSGVARRDIVGNSFAFTIKHDEWEERSDGTWLRTVKEVDELYDVGPVVYPAYPDTTVAKRSLEAVKATRIILPNEADGDRERILRLDEASTFVI